MTSQGLVDPLEPLDVGIQGFDIERLVTVYPDVPGLRWWAKAWFNGSELGEAAVEIAREEALGFIADRVGKDEMLERHYPSQVATCLQAIERTRDRLMGREQTA